jgi:anthranilate phosphoribosyltransferase
MLSPFLKKIKDGQTLSADESETAISSLLDGGVAEADIAAFLKALHQRGETEEEILGAARGLRAKMLPFPVATDAVDCCGTGGDHHGTFNVSSAVAFVLAGCGVKVAKHGNRAVSSKSGSSDLLTQLGVKVDAPTPLMKKALDEANICFLMAPIYHPAMKHVAPVRAKLGHRSIFNLLGPLANPARATRQLVGVYDKKWLQPYARILEKLGSRHVLAVHGTDGLDEITTTGDTLACEMKDGLFTDRTITPASAGLAVTTLDALKGGDAAANALKLQALLSGEKGAYRDIALINAAAAFMLAGKANDLKAGTQLAAQAIDSGQAKNALTDLVRISNG